MLVMVVDEELASISDQLKTNELSLSIEKKQVYDISHPSKKLPNNN